MIIIIIIAVIIISFCINLPLLPLSVSRKHQLVSQNPFNIILIRLLMVKAFRV